MGPTMEKLGKLFKKGHRSFSKPVRDNGESREAFEKRLDQWQQTLDKALPLFAFDSNVRRVADILLKASNGVFKTRTPKRATLIHPDTFGNDEYRNLSFEIMKYVKSIVDPFERERSGAVSGQSLFSSDGTLQVVPKMDGE